MIVSTSDTDSSIEYDELATMKHLARQGAINGTIQVTCGGLSESLGVSSQTISRRLQELDDGKFIDRETVGNGQRVTLTTRGTLELKRELFEYKDVFDQMADLEFRGVVADGLGKGADFVAMDGYVEQFVDKLGYGPFPGTLNIALTDKSVQRRQLLPMLDSIRIEKWERDGNEYGAVECYPASIRSSSGIVSEPVHVIVPHRSEHGEGHMEVIGPEKLRDAIEVSSGIMVTLNVKDQ
jgi:riboflavin kinase